MDNETLTAPVQSNGISSPVSAEPPATPAMAENTRRETTPRPRPEPVAVTSDMIEKTRTTLGAMLNYLGLDATVKADSKPGKINLLIASNDAGRIIGRKGQSLDSLQTLLNRMMQKGDEPFPKIYLDINGYSAGAKRGEKREGERERRSSHGGRAGRAGHDDFRRGDSAAPRSESEKDGQLRQQAMDSAKEVRRWGEAVTLPPMNSHDRRIIHITLESEKDLQTESTGEGNFKSVVISLKKEDAL